MLIWWNYYSGGYANTHHLVVAKLTGTVLPRLFHLTFTAS